MRRILPIVIGLLLTAGIVHGQVARLSQHGTGLLEIEAQPGDTLLIDLSADLGRHRVSGLTIYLQIPSDGFRILLDESTGGPFFPGDLFEGAVVVRNQVVTDGTEDLLSRHVLLEFTTLLGPSASRGRSGSGSIACFRLICERIMTGVISIYRSPVHESRVVLADGRTELPFFLAAPVKIRVDLDTAIRVSPWARVKTLLP